MFPVMYLLPFVLTFLFNSYYELYLTTQTILIISCVLCLVVLIFHKCSKAKNLEAITDTEYYGCYYVKVEYYEEWIENVKKIRREEKRKDDGTYETIEIEYWEEVLHPEEYYAITNDGSSLFLTEDEYRSLVILFANEQFVNLGRYWQQTSSSKLIKDGNKYESYWNKDIKTIQTVYLSRSYENRTLLENSVYRYEDFTKEEEKENNLFGYSSESVYSNINDQRIDQLRYLLRLYNCYYRNIDVKLNIIILKNEKLDKGLLYQRYWKGGKRNSFNIVVSLDDTNKIQWCHTFAWQNEEACVYVRNYIMENYQLGLNIFLNKFVDIVNLLSKKYKFANFDEYKYIKIHYKYSLASYIWCAVILFILNLFLFEILNGNINFESKAYEYIYDNNYAMAEKICKKIPNFYLKEKCRLIINLNISIDNKEYEKVIENCNKLIKLKEDKGDYYNNHVLYRFKAQANEKLKKYKTAILEYNNLIREYEYQVTKQDYEALENLYKLTNQKKNAKRIRTKIKELF